MATRLALSSVRTTTPPAHLQGAIQVVLLRKHRVLVGKKPWDIKRQRVRYRQKLAGTFVPPARKDPTVKPDGIKKHLRENSPNIKKKLKRYNTTVQALKKDGAPQSKLRQKIAQQKEDVKHIYGGTMWFSDFEKYAYDPFERQKLLAEQRKYSLYGRTVLAREAIDKHFGPAGGGKKGKKQKGGFADGDEPLSKKQQKKNKRKQNKQAAGDANQK